MPKVKLGRNPTLERQEATKKVIRRAMAEHGISSQRELAQKKNPIDIVRDAQVDRSSGARKYAVQILLAYNFGQREANRLPNLL